LFFAKKTANNFYLNFIGISKFKNKNSKFTSEKTL
jgi:hypothetical protein